jgi:hypothetical protein
MRNRANWVIALNILGATMVVIAALAIFGPVTTSRDACGSVIAPGNSDEMGTGQACDAARSDRTNFALLTGTVRLLALTGAMAFRRKGTASRQP